MKKFLFALLTLSLAACGGADQTAALEAADALREAENFQGAIDAYTEIIRQDNKNTQAFLGRAIAKMQNGDFLNAKVDYDMVFTLGGTGTGKEHFYYGFNLYAQSDFNGAIAQYDKAVAAGYELGETYTQRGICYGQIENMVAAVKDFTSAIEHDPKAIGAYTNRAYYRSALGDNRLALEDFDKAIELDPTDKSSWVNRGYTYVNTGEIEKALADIEKSLELDPEYFPALMYHGVCMIQLERFAEAVPSLDHALQVAPGHPRATYYRGFARVMAGDLPGGCQDLLAAQGMGNHDGDAVIAAYCQ